MPRVLLVGDPLLRKKCEPVPTPENGSLDTFLEAMNDVMVAEKGMGLAANQCGFSYRIFILKTELGYKEYINPEVLEQSEPTQFEGEGCLSIPGVTATTTRFNKLRLRWFTKTGVKCEEEFTGIKAFAVQHEMDHLNGKLYIDQFGPMKRTLVMDKHKKFLRLGR